MTEENRTQASTNLGLDLEEGADMTQTTTAFQQLDLSAPVDLSAPAEATDKFMGQKERRHSSVFKMFMYDYLGAASNKIVQERMAKNGDTKVAFADYCIKVNRRNKMQKRVLLITDQGIYNMDPVNYKVKRHIAIKDLGSLSLSKLPDNFFAIHVPEEYDYLMVSGRKTEIVSVLMMNFQNLMGQPLPLNFSDGFDYRIGPKSFRQIQFTKVDGGVSTQIFDKKP